MRIRVSFRTAFKAGPHRDERVNQARFTVLPDTLLVIVTVVLLYRAIKFKIFARELTPGMGARHVDADWS